MSKAKHPDEGGFPTKCPACGATHDSSSQLAGPNKVPHAIPMPGSLSICIACAALRVHDADGALHVATPEELRGFEAEAPDDMKIVRDVQAKIRYLHSFGGRS